MGALQTLVDERGGVSDDQTWRAPGAPEGEDAPRSQEPPAPAQPAPPAAPQPQYDQPQYGEYAPGQTAGAWQQQPEHPQQPGYQQPGYQQPGYAPPSWQQPGYQQPGGPQPGWAPPPRPGLIPLRPLSFGTLIGAPFQALRRNPKVTVGAALLLQGIPTIVVAGMITGATVLLIDRVTNANTADQDVIAAGAIGGTIVLGVLSIVVSTVFSALLQGVIVAEVARETLGEKLTFHSLWQLVRKRIGALIGWVFLYALAWIVAVALVVTVIIALAAIGGVAGTIGAVLVGLAGGAGLVVVGVWVNTKLAIVPSALVIERLPLQAAIARSWRLTTGYFWRTFGIILLIAAIIWGVTQVISTPFVLLGGALGGLFAPTSLSSADPSGFEQVLASQLGVNLIASVITAVVGAIGAVVQNAVAALIYIDLRMRKEGLELVRFVEARQAGQDLPDPYTRPAPAAPTTPWPGA